MVSVYVCVCVWQLDKAGPILTQRQYCSLVNPLEALLNNAKAAGTSPFHM